MKEFLEPKRVAVIGASKHEGKVGNSIFKNLLRNKQIELFPVNPNDKEVLGKKSFSSILEIEKDIDLAVIVIKAEFVPEALEQCGKKKVSHVIIISAGFSEAGDFALEDRVKKIAEKYDINLLGPNVLGTINPYYNFNTTFFDGMPPKGGIALISQSGAIGVSVLDMFIEKEIGMSGFVSLGDMAKEDFSDFIDYYGKDKNTKVIMLYIEGLKAGRGSKFIETCKRVSKIKPIVAIKAGKSKEGEKAAKSHTAALATEYEIYRGILEQAGIIEAESLKEMINISETLTETNYKFGKKACIVTNAGGAGVLATDALVRNEVEIASLSEKTKKEISSILPIWSKNNPVDIIGDADAERYDKVLKILERNNEFDFFIVILTPQSMSQPLETAEVILKMKKPVLACFIGGKKIEEAVKFLKEKKIPVFNDIDELAGVAGKIARMN
jgi:acetyltransferase